MLKHFFCYNVLISIVRHSAQKLWSRSFSCQSQGCKRIHYQIDPQHLNGSQDLLFYKNSSNKSDKNSHDINSELELQKLFN